MRATESEHASDTERTMKSKLKKKQAERKKVTPLPSVTKSAKMPPGLLASAC